MVQTLILLAPMEPNPPDVRLDFLDVTVEGWIITFLDHIYPHESHERGSKVKVPGTLHGDFWGSLVYL